MNALQRVLDDRLQGQREAGLFRRRKTLSSPQGVEVEVDGRRCLSFCSNDYLGLANHPQVIRALCAAAERYGVGSGASHLISGHSREHHALEEELAEFTSRPRALLFGSGYMANLGVINCLTRAGDHILQDRLNHASLLDGGMISRARLQRFHHGDTRHLAEKLALIESGNKLVVSDGVFSMDGDLAPLPEMVDVARKHDAWLMVDDAHGFGVLGESGGGVAEYYSLACEDLPILMGTLGKSFGVCGAFVAGSEVLIESLIQFARTYIYTTALPPAVAAACRASLEIIKRENWRREKLHALIRRFRLGIDQLGLELVDSPTAIQPVILRDSAQTMAAGQSLLGRGFWVGAIRPPTVPNNSARLRITLCAEHEEEQVDRLIEALGQVVKQ